MGESASGYTYIPIDPTKVHIEPGECSATYADLSDPKGRIRLLDLLPDNAVRMSMESSDTKGNVTYGVSKAGATGSTYKLTADYVNSDTVNKSIWIRKTALVQSTSTTGGRGQEAREQSTTRQPVNFVQGADYQSFSTDRESVSKEIKVIPGTEQYDVKSSGPLLSTDERGKLLSDGYEEFSVPVYVGVGLRIVAEGVSITQGANISGIGVIGAEAEAKRLVGSLTVQTLGVNSQAVASALPVQSELSRTTTENAFVAIGSIKSMLHQAETIKFPRVVGLYLPFPGGKPLVNALISELSRNPVQWCPNGYRIGDRRS
ncbi:MAG: hypothetical protein CK604_07390 [Curvibacter sp. PD_MW3]|nr:MAG: hypothetical protein CK604_07390 [Curvibacter sp. PD_MW3]